MPYELQQFHTRINMYNIDEMFPNFSPIYGLYDKKIKLHLLCRADLIFKREAFL